MTPLPRVSSSDEVAGGELQKWPKRLNSVPPRVSSGSIDGVNSEKFQQDMQLWKRRVSYYKTVNNKFGQKGRYRNILDMNAFLGGFAANLVADPLWVMNIVPVEAEVNTLGAIYERGLIGTYQSWYIHTYIHSILLSIIHTSEIEHCNEDLNFFAGVKQCQHIPEHMISSMLILCSHSTRTGKLTSFSFLFFFLE